MLFIQYALHHAWLIPLLPAVAFVLVGFFLRRLPAVARPPQSRPHRSPMPPQNL